VHPSLRKQAFSAFHDTELPGDWKPPGGDLVPTEPLRLSLQTLGVFGNVEFSA
jgi:hypothetical protein